VTLATAARADERADALRWGAPAASGPASRARARTARPPGTTRRRGCSSPGSPSASSATRSGSPARPCGRPAPAAFAARALPARR